ncbi:methionine adenosyltransferase [Desulforhabdus sp. TSK]|uniref:methionine adenosyltransferase n=1 Tax=Desulforhabdus sp. TSK TaxID=2925014 RepID=UPI001FC80F43|nr:methionine adenosyltransferase [Desulforhabdus sp. TSK]GKT10577.1 S-adenosylmethionine synthetase [Desulforhabdus sp. TSK]
MIVVESYKGLSAGEQSVEVVERKGKGHPDTICDSIMESISIALSQEYLKECGTILHHNIDKGMLAAGKTAQRFGGGRVVHPMTLIIGDRATFKAGGKAIPVKDIAVDAAKQWIGKNLRFVDPEKHLKYKVLLAEGSEELTDIFSRPGEIKGANDTSAAVGFYPLSRLEWVVMRLENYLNSEDFKSEFAETGEDVKVMGLRRGKGLQLTVAMPLIARYVLSEGAYFQRKARIYKEMQSFLENCDDLRLKDYALYYNHLDQEGRGLGGVYLSELGTSAEDADSGQVGRGNRVNGLISLTRPLGTEAAAGKNPVSHVGKIYNVLAHKMAREIYESVEGIKEVHTLLLSRIGMPINRPVIATAHLKLKPGRKFREIASAVRDVIAGELEQMGTFCLDLASGKYPVC